MRMQPCDAALPIEASSAVPWIPSPPKKPIQRALSGFSGTPPGMTCAGEAARPWLVRHAPGGVHLLVEHRVQAGRGLQSRLAHGDAVPLERLQVPVQRELEVVAIDDDHPRIPARKIGRLHGRPGAVHERSQNALVALVLDVEEDAVAQLRGVDRQPVAAGHAIQAGGRVVQRRVLGRAVQLAGHVRDEAVDDLVRVGDLRRQLGVQRTAGQRPPGAAEDVALAAASDGLVDRRLHVVADVGRARVQGEAPGAVPDDDRLVQARRQLALDLRARRPGAHPADVDSGHAHAAGDRVPARVVVQVQGDRPHDEDGQRRRDDGERSAAHG